MGAFSPTVKVEFAFGDDPLATSPTWTDESTYVEEISWRRGRNRDTDQFNPGSAEILLDNTSRRFDPQYAAGTHFGDLVPGVRVRITLNYSSTDYTQFVGFVDGWPQTYDSGDSRSTCTVRATDLFKILARHDLDDTLFTSWVKSLNPSHWWRLEESAGAGTVTDSGTGGVHGTAIHPPDFGQGGLDWDDAGSSTGGDGYGGSVIFVGSGSENPIRPQHITLQGLVDGWTTAVWLVKMPDPDIHDDPDGAVGEPGGAVLYSPGDISVIYEYPFDTYPGRLLVDDDTNGKYRYSTTTVVDGKVHVQGIKRNAASHPTIYLDGSGDSSLVQGNSTGVNGDTTRSEIVGYRSNDGSLPADLKEGFGGYLQHLALFDDVSGRMDEMSDAALTGYVGDQTGERIDRILDMAGVPAGLRDIDTGARSVGTAAPGGANALSYLQTIEATERGLLYCARDGKLTFVDRDAIATETRITTSRFTFSDDGADHPYLAGGLSFTYDDELIVNDVVVTGDGIEAQRAQDATSIDTYGRRSTTITTYLDNENTARNLAEYVVARRKDPQLRVDALAVKPERAPATMYPDVLTLEPGDRITVQRTPQGTGAQISEEMWVDGVAWQIGKDHDVTLTVWCSPVDAGTWITWGTSTWGPTGTDDWGF